MRPRPTDLPAPHLRRLWLDGNLSERGEGYPFNLPILSDPDFGLDLDQPGTIIAGENGTGKSTLIEAIATLAGFSDLGGGEGYRGASDQDGRDRSGATLAGAMRAGWLPKVTRGWFFRADTFFSVSQALMAAGAPGGYLAASHGEGVLMLLGERLAGQGLYLLDEPESALSPARQKTLLRLLAEVQQSARAQVIMATHSPILMAVPGADLRLVRRGALVPVDVTETPHFRLYREFALDPATFVEDALAGRDEMAVVTAEPPPMPPGVAAAFDAFPDGLRGRMFDLRRLVFRVAAETPGVGPLTETLKWGEPAWLTGATGSGSTVRLGRMKDAPGACALFFICRTGLVEEFRARFGDLLDCRGNRAILIDPARPLPEAPLSACLALALTWHRRRAFPSAGGSR